MSGSGVLGTIIHWFLPLLWQPCRKHSLLGFPLDWKEHHSHMPYKSLSVFTIPLKLYSCTCLLKVMTFLKVFLSQFLFLRSEEVNVTCHTPIQHCSSSGFPQSYPNSPSVLHLSFFSPGILLHILQDEQKKRNTHV